MNNLSSFLAGLTVVAVAASTGACTGTGATAPQGNSSTPPKFDNATPDRAQGRNSRGTPQQTGQNQDVSNNRR